MPRHVENARAVAAWLEQSPLVAWVNYPGLASHKDHARARKYLPKGEGAIIGFGIKGGMEAGKKFIDSVKLLSHLANIGDAKSLVIHPATTTHRQPTDDELTAAGVGPGTVRLSVGTESVADLIWDLEQGFALVAATAGKTKGEPISTWCGLAEVRLMAARMQRMVPEMSSDCIMLNRFPLFAPVSFIFEDALRLVGACHIAAGNVSWDVPFTRALEFIQRLGVSMLACLPLEPILLRELARERGLDVRRDLSSVRVIFCGGAVLPPALRRVLEQDWGARVVEIYGSNETMGTRLELCRGTAARVYGLGRS